MWQTLESDPSLFTELVELWGVQGIEFEELLGWDVESIRAVAPNGLLGIIFLFKFTGSNQRNTIERDSLNSEAPIYFAKQTVNNACATQALLSLVLNSEDETVKLGEHLQSFLEFTENLPPDIRGDTIASDDFLRTSHNSMCRPISFVGDESRLPTDEDTFHYVTYIIKNGHLYELDGLQEAPIDHGAVDGESPYSSYSRALQKKFEQYGSNEVMFSALGAIHDKQKFYASKGWDEMAKEEEEKRRKQRRDNALRRQQYTGLAIELLKQMAQN